MVANWLLWTLLDLATTSMGSLIIAVGVVVILGVMVATVAYRDGYRQGVEDAASQAKVRARLFKVIE